MDLNCSKLGGIVVLVEGLFASQENTVQWRGAVDPRACGLVGSGAIGSVHLQDDEGNPVAGAERVPAAFRRPGWYEATVPASANLVAGKNYTINFKLISPSGTAGHCRCAIVALSPEPAARAVVARPSG